MSETLFLPATRDDGTEVFVEIAVNSWGSAPMISGPPEHCHDGDPMEAEIVDCWLAADDNRADAPSVTLTDAEHGRILDHFYENPPEPDYGDD